MFEALFWSKYYILKHNMGFPDRSVKKKKKNLPAIQETLVRFLSPEDTLEKR